MDRIDFLPERIRNQRTRRQRLARQGYLLLACMLAVVALGYIRHGRVSTASAELAMLQRSSENVQCQTARRQVLEQQLADMAIRKRVEEHLGSRVSAQLVLAELQHLSPASICMTKLELETAEIELSRKNSSNLSIRAAMAGSGDAKPETVKRLRLTLTGLAPNDVDVANFIGQLSASQLFEDVNMGYTKGVTIDGRAAREFSASCYVIR